MNDGTIGSRSGPGESAHLHWLVFLAAASACLYGIIALLSWRFDFDGTLTERPIIPVLVLFGAAFAGYLFAIRVAAHAPQGWKLLNLIVCSAVIFRVVLLFSMPIQEIDIYRYLWDGAVSTTGVSPFRYSPDQVRTAADSVTADEDLRTVVGLLEQDPALAEILRRIHYGELPTIYPPVSQIVFAAAALTTPAKSSLESHVFIMKAWLIAFDLATLFLVIGLLRRCDKPVGLCIIYAWCPLLMKEVANSGHLDAIAVFLTVLAVYLAARLLTNLKRSPTASTSSILYGSAAALVLALAVGAKLYPVVLAPLMLLVFAKQAGWRQSSIPAVVLGATTLLVLWPLLPGHEGEPPASSKVASDDALSASDQSATSASVGPSSDPSLGVTTFLRRWEMNDFIFLLLAENLKPASQLVPERTAWFSVVPDSAAQRIVAGVTSLSGFADHEGPFLCARAITAVAFLTLACWFAIQAARRSDVAAFCEAAFLTLAWFWLLCPTQNPWYWTWALPLLPFARSRAWLAVSGLVMLYYLRFWLSYHWPDTSVLRTSYTGSAFFDFVVTWIEYAPWFIWLAAEAWLRNRQGLSGDAPNPKVRLPRPEPAGQ